MFINDREVNRKSLLMKSADDTKIGTVVKNDEDKAVIQSDLDPLIGWAHSKKCILTQSKARLYI